LISVGVLSFFILSFSLLSSWFAAFRAFLLALQYFPSPR
jgi:hypothetical protein